MENLVIVESPTKARTLSRFLGNDYRIEPTMGHIRDLPKTILGVDTEHDFKPKYVIPAGRKKRVLELKKIASNAKKIILATDPDREGEAIAWHVTKIIQTPSSKFQTPKLSRIVFHEITERAVHESVAHPRDIDMQLVDAQQTRRILDRLVGYKLSPLLWQKVRKGLSAGRVQSVAVRLIVEREREIKDFKPVEYWEIEAELAQQSTINNQQSTVNSQQSIASFRAKLISKNGEKVEIHSKDEADGIMKNLEGAEYKVSDVQQKEVRKYPYPPFMTSTLQQAAGNKFGWSAKRTMQIAQNLYEEGFITYHRTDSFNLSAEAIKKTRDYIEKNFGRSYLPEAPRVYKTKSKVAQEAHEAIRPTEIDKLQTQNSKIQNDLGREALRLYELIWKRMVACQMSEAVYDQTTVDIAASLYTFRASGIRIKFDGWKKIFNEEVDEEKERILPSLSINEVLNLLSLLPSQHFTEAPPRYTEASLVKALEERGIGRPSTYAPIISTICERQYVEKIERKFQPTALGIAVNDFLVKYFPKIIDYSFTATMEDDLDGIARGEKELVSVIREFYDPFVILLTDTAEKAGKVKIEVEKTDEKCDKCGSSLVVRVGRYGKFLACSTFPKCDFTKPYLQTTGLTCPKCQGNIILRRTKKGKHFYGCSNYPKCDFASWTKPQNRINN